MNRYGDSDRLFAIRLRQAAEAEATRLLPSGAAMPIYACKATDQAGEPCGVYTVCTADGVMPCPFHGPGSMVFQLPAYELVSGGVCMRRSNHAPRLCGAWVHDGAVCTRHPDAAVRPILVRKGSHRVDPWGAPKK